MGIGVKSEAEHQGIFKFSDAKGKMKYYKALVIQ